MSDFDPTRYLTKVSGKDYLEVKWRLVWLRSARPDASIVTELTHFGPDMAVFKATVSWMTDTGIAMCTGWGQEEPTDFSDFLEKAETKAIGRALAAAGYGTQFCQDHEFGADVQRVVDSPVGNRRPRQQAAQPVTTDDLATHIERIIADANACTERIHRGRVQLLHDEATNIGVRNDPEVDGALQAAKARLWPAEQPALVQA